MIIYGPYMIIYDPYMIIYGSGSCSLAVEEGRSGGAKPPQGSRGVWRAARPPMADSRLGDEGGGGPQGDLGGCIIPWDDQGWGDRLTMSVLSVGQSTINHFNGRSLPRWSFVVFVHQPLGYDNCLLVALTVFTGRVDSEAYRVTRIVSFLLLGESTSPPTVCHYFNAACVYSIQPG